MIHDVIDVAKYVLWYCNKMKKGMSNLKLQKILYFLQAEFLVTADRPLFTGDIEAWDWGPVIPRVYRRWALFGSDSSLPVYTSFNDLKDFQPNLYFTNYEQTIINDVIDYFDKYSASNLTDLTCRQYPWREAYQGSGTINLDILKNYFMPEEK